jgi:hypothetical protein
MMMVMSKDIPQLQNYDNYHPGHKHEQQPKHGAADQRLRATVPLLLRTIRLAITSCLLEVGDASAWRRERARTGEIGEFSGLYPVRLERGLGGMVWVLCGAGVGKWIEWV